MRLSRLLPSSGVLFALLLGLLVWAPIPIGSNRPWAWAILELWAFALGLLWLAKYARSEARPGAALRGARIAVGLLAAWLALIAFQLAPLPGDWLQVLSPEAARNWRALEEIGAGAPRHPLSLEPHATQSFLLRSIAYATVFCLSLALIDTERRAARAATVLVLSGLGQALVGSLLSLSGLREGPARGTYVNQNHLAGYLLLCLSVGIGLMLGMLGPALERSWRQWIRDLAQLLLSPKLRLRLYLAIMVVALVLTRSRMGNSAFFASLLIAGTLFLLLARGAGRNATILIASLILIDVLIVGTWFGIERVRQRMEAISLQTETRDDVSELTFRYWQDFPLFGSGGGTFYAVFPRYRSEGLAHFHDHAHNDYLQFAAETGAIGLGLLALLVGSTLYVALRALRERRTPAMRGLAFGAIMAITALLIHSAVDFNLQIPANALTFVFVLSLGWIARYAARG